MNYRALLLPISYLVLTTAWANDTNSIDTPPNPISNPAIDATAPRSEKEASASPHTFTGNIALVSQYVFRGLTQTNGKPAIQGGVDYSHKNGFYLGSWMSNISWYTEQNSGTVSSPAALSAPGNAGAPYTTTDSNSASIEWDFYGGFKNSFANDWNYDFGIIQYYYPGTYHNLGAYRNPNTTEIYGLIGYKWISLKYSKAVSSNTFGTNESKGASYVDLTTTIPLQDSGFNLLAHVGRQLYPDNPNTGYWGTSGGNNGYYSYTDYKVGLTKDYFGVTWGLAWTYAKTQPTGPDGQTTAYFNAYGDNIGRNRVALSVTKTF